jgi:hypothetical protein
MTSESFPALASALEAAGFVAWCEPAAEGKPISSLFVMVHVDAAERRYVLQAFDAKEVAAAVLSQVPDLPAGLLQLTLQYPFPVRPATFADTARLLHRLSNLLPIGTFLLAEDEQAVCYRTMIPTDSSGVSAETLVGTLVIIRHFCVECAGLIEAVASGEMSLDEAAARASAPPGDSAPKA